ncbi:uncharacterized protein LOC129744220 [Uranotaenia lowii]|uniref:uncharacterized protein LOC129744220 n=1 Tax=Uranotaenia lowii TaxID=190385 RepID=UPI00247AB258|nr:uncharacterized protein LOC129744220 [Uranotaenia lowii]
MSAKLEKTGKRISTNADLRRVAKQATNHDNGADGSSSGKVKPQEKTKTSLKSLFGDSPKKRKSNINPLEEINKMKAKMEKLEKENEELRRALASFVESKTTAETDERRAMNQMNFVNISECIPINGETEINKRSYEHWKNVINSAFNIAQTSDENIKIDVLKMKAGSYLLDLLKSTTTQQGMPDEKIQPYSNAISRLDSYFNSSAYSLSQKMKLSNMVQKPSETNMEYVNRVTQASKLCNFNLPSEEFEAISRTITRGSKDSRIRTLAYRVLTEGGTLGQFIDHVRNREVELENEEEYQRLHQQKLVTVAAVSYKTRPNISNNRGGQNRRGYFHGRGRGSNTKYLERKSYYPKACWRCLSTYHSPDDCEYRTKVCHICNESGHIKRACKQSMVNSRKRFREDNEEEQPKKIACIKQNEDFVEDEVMEN